MAARRRRKKITAPTFNNADDQLVWDALETDQAHRYAGVTGDIFDLESLDEKEFTRWKGSLPVWGGDRAGSAGSKKPQILLSDRARMESFGLEKLVGDGLIIAGGAISTLIRTGDFNTTATSDVDIFIVGLTPEQARTRINKLARDLNPNMIIRTQRTITFDAPRNVQVVLRIYRSISEVLHGFDMGSAAVAWDGNRYYGTTLGILSHIKLINVIDLSKRRNTYEYRLVKYFLRGFDIVLPNFSNDIPASELPYLDIHWRRQQLRIGASSKYIKVDRSTFRRGSKIPVVDPKLSTTEINKTREVRDPSKTDSKKIGEEAYDLSITYQEFSGRESIAEYNLFRLFDRGRGYLEADINKLAGFVGISWREPYDGDVFEIRPVFHSAKEAVKIVRRMLGQDYPYMLKLRIILGNDNATRILADNKAFSDIEIEQIYDKRMEHVRQLRFPPDFEAVPLTTRIMDTPDAIPLKPISDKEWYEEDYVP